MCPEPVEGPEPAERPGPVDGPGVQDAALARLVRDEAGLILAALHRRLGDFDDFALVLHLTG